MSFIQQVTDESCFIRLIWDDGTEDDINKADIKIFLREGLVIIEDDSLFSAEIDYTKVTTPLSGTALILHDTIVTYADTNPCEAAGGGSGDVVGPASATADNIAVFNGTTGKLIKDGGATVASLAPKASPTFTGTVTTPAIIVSGETASEIAHFDASKNIKSLPVATYPSLAELAYVKGLTSSVQTQLNAIAAINSYSLQFSNIATTVNPADATTYYIGLGGSPTGVATTRRIYIPATSVIRAIYFYIKVAGLASAENSSLYIRLNNTTDTTVSTTVQLNAVVVLVNNTGLSTSVNAGDYIELKFVAATFATNPTGVSFEGSIFLKT